MRIKARFALIAALLGAPAAAQTVRVEPLAALPGAPMPTLSAPIAPASLAAAPIGAAPALTPGFLSASVPVAAAPAAAAPAAAVVAAPAPEAAAALPPAAAVSVPAGRGPSAVSPTDTPASADLDAAEGRALFDRAAADSRPLAELLREHAGRSLRGGVFIQQEHEGSLLSPDPRDSSGDVFRYYHPVEMRPGLVAETDRTLNGFDKLVNSVRRAFQIRGRGTPEAAWRAWPLSGKLDYLDRLEEAVSAEGGPRAAWDGKVSLILKRVPGAPDFAAEHPHMEAPPEAHRGDAGARYLQPEIVSAVDKPAASVDQALRRARTVIADTGHAGVQFHVFVKAEPAVLLAQLERLDGALQLVNDALFAEAAADSEQNLVHPSLLPWHRGRSERVRALLEAAEARPSVPAAEDPDSEKHAFVGLRYWGLEDGKAVISFELRGVSIPWKQSASAAVKGLESPELPKRDYSPAQRYLTFLSIYAEALARGAAPPISEPSVVLDQAAAESFLRARARALGVPDEAYDGLAALARRLTGSARVPPSYLLPFASSPEDSPELRALADEMVPLAARLKASEDAGRETRARHDRYLFWSAYADWARAFGARRSARFEALVRAAAGSTGR